MNGTPGNRGAASVLISAAAAWFVRDAALPRRTSPRRRSPRGGFWACGRGVLARFPEVGAAQRSSPEAVPKLLTPSNGNDIATRILDATECVVVVTEVGTGTVVSMNQAAADVTGYAAQEVIGPLLWGKAGRDFGASVRTGVLLRPDGGRHPHGMRRHPVDKVGRRTTDRLVVCLLMVGEGVRTHVVMTGIDLSRESTKAYSDRLAWISFSLVALEIRERRRTNRGYA